MTLGKKSLRLRKGEARCPHNIQLPVRASTPLHERGPLSLPAGTPGAAGGRTLRHFPSFIAKEKYCITN